MKTRNLLLRSGVPPSVVEKMVDQFYKDFPALQFFFENIHLHRASSKFGKN